MGTPALLSLVFLCVLCASVVSPASAQTTITGTVKDASGTALTSGTIIFALSQEGTVTDPALLVVQPVVTCTITNGVIGTCSLRGNDEISPAGTFYRVRIISSGGRTFLPERRYTISGATWDIGTSTPLASDTIAAQAYQIVQDEGANLTQRQKINFVGAGVSVSDDSGNAVTKVTITGSGSAAFTDLTDTPGSYAGQGSLCVAVKSSVDGLEFISCGSGGGATHQIDGVALTTQDPINFLDTSEFDWTNPAAGNLSLALKAASVADSKLTSNYSGVGSCTNQFVRGVNGNAAPTCESIADADLPSTNALDTELHAQSHVLDGADHAVSGLTVGNYLRALTASTFGFSAILDGDLPASIARDSELHAQSHGAADHTGDVIPAANQNFGAFYSDFGEIATPTNPSAGVVRVYAKSGSGELCSRDSAGSENCMSTGAGGANHDILSTTHSDTTTAAVVRGDLVVGQSATPSWQRLALGPSGQYPRSNGTDLVYSAIPAGDLPNHDVACASNPCVDDAEIVAAIARDSELHAQSHVLATTAGLGADHTTSGLTAGQVLRATAAGAAAFQSLQDADLPASISRDAEAPGAGDIGGSLSAGYTIDAGAVASPELATANKTFVQPVVLFDSTGLLDADDIPSVFRPGRAVTVTEVWCETDAGTPSVNLQRDDGTPANILSSNLTCTTGGATGTIAGAEDNVAATERIDFVMVSASTAKRISLMIKYTVD